MRGFVQSSMHEVFGGPVDDWREWMKMYLLGFKVRFARVIICPVTLSDAIYGNV